MKLFGYEIKKYKINKVEYFSEPVNQVLHEADLVACEKCGCAVIRWHYEPGKSEIRRRKTFPLMMLEEKAVFAYEEFVYTPRYCKRCYSELPKGKK